MTIFRQMLQAKIQGAVITKRILDYNGSIGIDQALLTASDILPGEKVQVLNLNNGKRIETYVIEEQANSGIVACMVRQRGVVKLVIYFISSPMF